MHHQHDLELDEELGQSYPGVASVLDAHNYHTPVVNPILVKQRFINDNGKDEIVCCIIRLIEEVNTKSRI